ncbi:MAG: hypothetical protein ACREUQ_05975, partial [Burkholderiales bacterium]
MVATEAALNERPEFGQAFWRSLLYFNVYRLIVALILLVVVTWLGENLPFGTYSRKLYLYADGAYIVFTLLAFVPILQRQIPFNLQLAVYVCADVLVVVLILHASGGISNGLGLL